VGELVLPSIHIRGYKAFRDFRLEKLGRVNLITGRNGTGKTAFLEAVEIYATAGGDSVLWSAADPVGFKETFSSRAANSAVDPKVVSNLFYGRGTNGSPPELSVGGVGDESRRVDIHLGWGFSAWDEDLNSPAVMWSRTPTANRRDVRPMLKIDSDGETDYLQHFMSALEKDAVMPASLFEVISCARIPLNGLNLNSIRDYWDKILLTEEEELIHETLRKINPSIRRLAFIGPEVQIDSPRAIIKLENLPEPVPLSSLGEGLTRLLGVACSLVKSREGFLLVDEIETGLHYSMYREMWRLIFETARRLNIQVFATTHSGDCAEDFAAIARDFDDDGMLFRLFRSDDGDIKARSHNSEDLKAILEFEVEVR